MVIPDQAISFTDRRKLDNEVSDLDFKDFVRVSGIDIEIEF